MAEGALASAETGCPGCTALGAASSLEALDVFFGDGGADTAFGIGVADAELGDGAHLACYPGGEDLASLFLAETRSWEVAEGDEGYDVED